MAAMASALFALALMFPLFSLHVLSRSGVSTMMSGPARLRDEGFSPLSVVVVATLIALPATKLAIELAALLGVAWAPHSRVLAWLFGWREPLSAWAMAEVYVLASIVAYSRLEALAHVDVGLAALALGAATLGMVAIDTTLDGEAIWQRLGSPSREPLHGSTPEHVTTARWIGCSRCHRVALAGEGERCARCGHRLASRGGPLQRVWALVIAAALLYVPANVLPVMTIQRLSTRGTPTTILHGVVELVQGRLWPLAVLVFSASIVIPVVKLASLVTLLVLTHVRSAARLAFRTRLLRFVRFIGRWSMIDIFVLSVLVGVVRFGAIASVVPGMGATAFCAVVLLTMGATELFDPRRMWDTAHA